MKCKEIIVRLSSTIGRIIYPFYIVKHKLDLFKKLLYGQLVKYSSVRPPKVMYAVKPITLIGAKYIVFGEKVQVGQYSTISAWSSNGNTSEPKIFFHDNVTVGAFAHITAVNKIVIEEGALLGKYVTITDNSHGMVSESEINQSPIKRDLFSKGMVKISKNVWVGDKVTILPNVSVGEGAIIGSNSVVTKDIPPFSVACGIPAQIIKKIKN